MTQEELDAMMNGDVDLDAVQSDETCDAQDDSANVNAAQESAGDAASWPPPAPTDDNKMVNQLDDVTRESEQKSSEIFDIIEVIGDDLMNSESTLSGLKDTLTVIRGTFQTLHEQFPAIETFKNHLNELDESVNTLDNEVEVLQNSGDQIMNAMDIMQYQDIHRQKIERVINVMRALSKYMNTLFSSQVDDATRVSSAQHIVGDTHNEDVMSEDDIEALLNSFNN